MTYFLIKGHLDDINRGRCLSFSDKTTHSLVRDTFFVFCLGIIALGSEAQLLWRIVLGMLWYFLSLEGLQLGFDKLSS
jgi:hypothetical protein